MQGDTNGVTRVPRGGSAFEITQNTTNASVHTCVFGAPQHNVTIRIGGVASGYSTTDPAFMVMPADRPNLYGISGSLGAIFPTLNGSQPKFIGTFKNCTNLVGSIPDNLFSGIYGVPVSDMFKETFYGCSGLTGNVPTGLFSGISGTVDDAMNNVFLGCGNLNSSCPDGTSIITDTNTAYSWAYYTSKWVKDDSGERAVACDVPSGPTYDFTITTTNEQSGFDFSWDLAADGTFYVDCGDTTATLIYPDASTSSGGVGTIIRSHANASDRLPETYTCSYVNGGVKTISFGGEATAYRPTWGYVNGSYTSKNTSISFKNNRKLTTIAGSLGAIFSTLSMSSYHYQPNFMGTFSGCTSLTGQIPENLFGGVSGGNDNMFYDTFSGCTSLTGPIPENLFRGISGAGGNNMFVRTFYGCTRLTSDTTTHTVNGQEVTYAIPENLFRDVTYGRLNTFNGTFAGCTSLTGQIPENLFSNVNGSGQDMFSSTFARCTGLTGPIPENLFRGVTGNSGIFKNTFSDCIGLTSDTTTHIVNGQEVTYAIPENLFRDVNGTYNQMFNGTFSGCTGLTGQIPENLFSGVRGDAASDMFRETFYRCSGLTGQIPENLFSGVSGTADSMFRETFWNCGGLTGTIPENLFSGVRGDAASEMFRETFWGCTGLTGQIPENLFSGVSGTANGMFRGVFGWCTGVTGPIPKDLFRGVSGVAASEMFLGTFYNCTNLGKENGVSAYYIPPELFNGISGNATDMFKNVFIGTGLVQCCPAGTRKLTTNDEAVYNTARYVGSFSDRVSCIADTPPVGELTLVDGQCIENCGKQLNIKPDNAGQTKTYSMYKRTGTLVGDKTLNIKETGATDTCYVPLKSVNNAPSGGIQGVLRISVNGNTYYAEPANY